MKPQSILGIALIVAGVVVLAYQGFSYTTREKAIDLGPLQVTAEKTHNVPLPPIIGVVALVGGVLLLVTGRAKA
jgi:drug/metabolite transporter (DMT)-like permease